MPTASSAQINKNAIIRAKTSAIRCFPDFTFLKINSIESPAPVNNSPAIQKSNKVHFTSLE